MERWVRLPGPDGHDRRVSGARRATTWWLMAAVVFCASGGPGRATGGQAIRAAAWPPVDVKKVRELIVQLDARGYHDRDAAHKALMEMGPGIEPELRSVLKGKPSEEVRIRIERLLEFLRRFEVSLAKLRLRARAKFPIPKANLEIPKEMAPCAANLRKIYAAIEKHDKDNRCLPGCLSDLSPKTLDAKMLLCPADPNGRSKVNRDPKRPCSYSYEFSSAPAPLVWDETRTTTCRNWKPAQVTLFGDVVPIVRCDHHGPAPLNVTVTGRLYWGKPNWEWMFIRDYCWGDELPGGRMKRYRVKRGDAGFWAVAKNAYGNGKYWALVAKANPNTPSNALRVGQVLIIPPLPAPGARPEK